jgi:hypothetical protein
VERPAACGRRDITRLARQIGRTEDKLEQVLQELERLREEVDASRDNGDKPAAAAKPASARRRSPRSSSR